MTYVDDHWHGNGWDSPIFKGRPYILVNATPAGLEMAMEQFTVELRIYVLV